MPTKKKPENWELKIYPEDHDMNKSWFIQLEYIDPQTGELCRKQYRNGINYYKVKSERLNEAKSLVNALKLKLQGGWNPITNTVYKPTATTNFEELPLNQALNVGLTGKQDSLAEKSYKDISGVVRFFQTAAVKIGLDRLPVAQVRKKHIKLILDQVAKDRQHAYKVKWELRYSRLLRKTGSNQGEAAALAGKMQQWTGNSYNKYKEYVSGIFTELEDLEAVEFNPCHNITKKPEITTNIHRHASEREEVLIKQKLLDYNPYFFIYLATEHGTGIRPKELLGLQGANYDRINQCFDVEYTIDGSKTRTFRKVPIPDTLMTYLEKIPLDKVKPTDYIFSTDFRPGPIRINRKVVTDLWRVLIKEGLGINITLYSFKGKGGEEKRRAGIDLFSVGSGWGHGHVNMSKLYLHGEQDRINEEIRTKTPAF